MRVVALGFGGAELDSAGRLHDYVAGVLAAYPPEEERLVVLPGLAGLYLGQCFGWLGKPGSTEEAYGAYLEFMAAQPGILEDIFGKLARENGCWLVTGSFPVRDAGNLYHEAALISPRGDVAGRQRQVFLSRAEKALGMSRGEDLHVFAAGSMKLGLLLQTDGFYPETGRILAAKGAGLVAHCGALPEGDNRWLQFSALWQQVQQNQFFAVESQLCAEVGGVAYGADCRIHAPTEMTEGYTGILAEGREPVSAVPDEKARQTVIQGYPLLKLLNPLAYGSLACEGGEGV
jgi:predicted amidohydrolase